MPGYVFIVDAFGLIFAAIGFVMAFRQSVVRRMLGLPKPPATLAGREAANADPLTYVLRIAGVMVMIFGITIAGMVTLFNFLQQG